MEGSATTEELSAEATYEAMAPAYDAFTAHYDEELWLGNLLPRLERHQLRKGRLLDVGCGTGKSFLPMLARGWDVTACDISSSMLDIARSKVGEDVKMSVADMRQLPHFGEFELVWALDDTVNYLLNGEELEAGLIGMRANLLNDGLMMFDLHTLLTYRTFFAERHVVERAGMRMIWTGQATPDVQAGSICEARFEVEGEGEGDEVEAHLHSQRHFPEAEVLAALERVGLECLEVFGHHYDAVLKQPLDEAEHTKAVYIARKSRP
jgi:SAM-dependent methyltransferase